MDCNQEIIYPHKLIKSGRGGDAVKEGCRLVGTTFLSLLYPLSFLLLARLSTARYFSSVANDNTVQPDQITLLTSIFFYTKTTLILNLLVSLVTVAALTQSIITGKGVSNFMTQRCRCRLCAAWILLFMVQICLSLGIYGTTDAEINSHTVGSLVLPRRLFLVLGLHETTAFWCRNVVKPAVLGVISEEDFKFRWVEKVLVAVAFGNLWWRRLGDEVEALVLLPRVMAELGMDVAVADGVGWWLYYLTVAIGGLRVVKGFVWAVTWIFNYRPVKKGGNSKFINF